MSQNQSNSFAQLVERFEQIRQQMVEEGTAVMKFEFQKVFETYPEITVIKWTQYTPYFNDGDECVFGVNDFTVSNAPDPNEVDAYGEYEGDEEGIWAIDTGWGEGKKKYPVINALNDFAQTKIGEEVFRGTFGDHSIVTVTRDGIDVEEYEHD